jgi:hypothetical protein
MKLFDQRRVVGEARDVMPCQMVSDWQCFGDMLLNDRNYFLVDSGVTYQMNWLW